MSEYWMLKNRTDPKYMAKRKAMNDAYIDHDFDYYFTGEGLIQTKKQMKRARKVYISQLNNGLL